MPTYYNDIEVHLPTETPLFERVENTETDDKMNVENDVGERIFTFDNFEELESEMEEIIPPPNLFLARKRSSEESEVPIKSKRGRKAKQRKNPEIVSEIAMDSHLF